MKKLFSMLAFVGFIALGTTGSAVADDVDAMKAVAEVNTRWNEAFNSGDSVALAELYADTATVSPGNGTVLNGREAIASLYKSFIDNGVYNHSIDTIKVYHQQTRLYNWVNGRRRAPMTSRKLLLLVVS
ncbi:YybH family protein [Methylophaga sulfidovorans]|uniref:DUF4440 domain-containing protein n=1 Tax=Methylophaga sulfidovorans TaxID=45496 RepID=A0A1I4B8Y5_9GAMM|nr:SgcJ/EcaC family oxidoreductase [Methylophaga sulfidovorans]SFK65318.1 conserved hypothetical protein [Methylophaga sulfidovorans]